MSSIPIITSKLLIWPRRRNGAKRKGQKRYNNTEKKSLSESLFSPGYILGWKAQQNHRQTIICIGILPPTLPLEEYKKQIDRLVDEISESKEPKLCSCLINSSLDIVGYFNSNQREDQSSHVETNAKNHSLPTISLRRGYPWWDDDEDKNSNLHRQVLYYNKQSDNFSHLSSDYCTDNDNGLDGWQQILYRLNHAQEIYDMILTQQQQQQQESSNNNTLEEMMRSITLSQPMNPSQKSHVDESLSASDQHEDNQTNKQQIHHRILMQSLTFLHFQQRWKMLNNSISLSIVPLFQCVQVSYYMMFSATTTRTRRNQYICPCCDRTAVVLNKQNAIKRYVTQWDKFMSVLMDLSLGTFTAIVIVLVLRYYEKNQLLSNAISSSGHFKQSLTQRLQDNISWLEEFPVGFKLNERLTQNMGTEIRNMVAFYQNSFLASTIWNIEMWKQWLGPILAILAGVGGISTFLAVAIDLVRLDILHISLLLVWFRNCYKVELYLLGAFFRVFRGKKWNILRQRTDTMEYDAMQLLVGTIGFSICIFLWTTILVYYTFFVVWNLILHIPMVCLWILYTLTSCNCTCNADDNDDVSLRTSNIPWGRLFWRLIHREWFTENVYVQTQQDSDFIHVSWLFPIVTSPMKILGSALSIHLKPLIKWLVGFCLEILIPRNSNRSPYTIPFETLLLSPTTSSA